MIDLRSELPKGYAMSGDGNQLSVGKNCTVRAHIEVVGSNNKIEIEDNVYFNKGWIGIRASNATLKIGIKTTIVGAVISFHEPGVIKIGNDCQFSTDIFMDVSDMHPLFDIATGERINPAKNIEIGNHVWIGQRVIVLKGATIMDGAVIAAGAVVSGTIGANVCAGGVPARVIREGVRWERRF